MADLKLINVRKTYGRDVHILKGVDLDISDGEFIVLVGPSGCGKSTLLRAIAGLEPITSGEIHIGGRRVDSLPPKDRDTSMVFQSYALYPHMTVEENMAFSLTIRRVDREEIGRKVHEAAEMLGLGDLLKRKPKDLSGGQRQRVAIGRAIVRKPSVFLFDEPLSNLDANLRAQMRVELRRLHGRLKTTMVYVTHDQIEAMTLADRICVLEGGELRQVDPPRRLYDAPNGTFVASFIGSPPMNFLAVERTESGEWRHERGSFGRDSRLSESLPNRLLVGIRPHELSFSPGSSHRIDAMVEAIEPIGWDLHVHVRCGETRLIAHLAAEEAPHLEVGQAVTLYPDDRKLRYFDPQTTRAIEIRHD